MTRLTEVLESERRSNQILRDKVARLEAAARHDALEKDSLRKEIATLRPKPESREEPFTATETDVIERRMQARIKANRNGVRDADRETAWLEHRDDAGWKEHWRRVAAGETDATCPSGWPTGVNWISWTRERVQAEYAREQSSEVQARAREARIERHVLDVLADAEWLEEFKTDHLPVLADDSIEDEDERIADALRKHAEKREADAEELREEIRNERTNGAPEAAPRTELHRALERLTGGADAVRNNKE
jgi:hypothetical protein